jgi:integrase
MTVKQFLDAWVRDTLSVSGLDPRTIGNYERAVRLRLVPALGKVKLAKLTPMHVQRFVGAQLAAGVGPTAVQQALTTLRMALKQAVLWGMLPRNVAALVDGVRVRSPGPEPFARAEQRAILAAARGDRLYLMVVLAYATGLRQSELLGMRWSDLDLDAGWLRVRQQMGRKGQFKHLKTQAGRRRSRCPRTS